MLKNRAGIDDTGNGGDQRTGQRLDLPTARGTYVHFELLDRNYWIDGLKSPRGQEQELKGEGDALYIHEAA